MHWPILFSLFSGGDFYGLLIIVANRFESDQFRQYVRPSPEVIDLEFIIKLKIKRNDWLLADTCPQAANHRALF